jgi:hypothetical protein
MSTHKRSRAPQQPVKRQSPSDASRGERRR